MNRRTSVLRFVSVLICLSAFQAQATSAFGDAPDLYGHVLVNPPHVTTDAHGEPGQGDSYGSVLLDPSAKATTDALVERGEADQYGSVLLGVAAADGRAHRLASN